MTELKFNGTVIRKQGIFYSTYIAMKDQKVKRGIISFDMFEKKQVPFEKHDIVEITIKKVGSLNEKENK